MRVFLSLILMTTMVVPLEAGPEEMGPLDLDENTLLLARYAESIDADYAVVDPRAEGQARLVEGLFGKAIHASKGWMTPETTVAEIEMFPLFVPITYARDNVNPRSGCLEMYVNFAEVVEPEYFRRVMTWESGIYYASGYVILALRPAEEEQWLQLIVKSPVDGAEVTLSAPFPYEWAGTWRHIGFQWDAERYGLIIDGEVVAEEPAVADGMPAPDTRIAIGAHARGVNVAEALIDELRISDTPRY